MSRIVKEIYARLMTGLVGLTVPKQKRMWVRQLVVDAGLIKILQIRHRLKHQPSHFPYTLSLTMCVKDEGPYLKEWIEYYLLQGVDHFYLYNNNGTDNSRELLAPYIEKGLVSWHEYPGQKKQEEIYNHALSHYQNETEWMGFVDADEFVVPMQDPDLKTALKRYRGKSQVLVRWMIFGSAGQKQKEKGLVIERFKYRAAQPWATPKCFVNPRAVGVMKVHSAAVVGETVNEQGTPVFNTHMGPITADILRCHHYAVKSAEEYLRKRNRWSGENRLSIMDTYFQNHDLNDVKDDTMDKFVPLLSERV